MDQLIPFSGYGNIVMERRPFYFCLARLWETISFVFGSSVYAEGVPVACPSAVAGGEGVGAFLSTRISLSDCKTRAARVRSFLLCPLTFAFVFFR